MKRLLTLVLFAAALPAHAGCPAPEQWARDFHKTHADFYSGPPRLDRALYTPAFGAALQREWNYAKGEVGHLDYDPWLGAQDGDMAPPFVFEVESEAKDSAVVAMRYGFVLDPGAKPAKHAVHLVLKKEAQQCWRLDDFITPLGDSLMRLYAPEPDAGATDKAAGAR